MASEPSKSDIRDAMRDRRRSLNQAEQQSLSRRICEQIQDTVDFTDHHHILLYYPAPEEREVDLRLLFKMAFGDLSGTQCLLPRVDPGDGTINPHVIPDDHLDNGDQLKAYYSLTHEESPLSKGGFGIPEPEPHRCPLVEPQHLDLVFVPGLAFDRDGYRVGYGGGYYDRLLADLPPETMTLGVCYRFQQIERCPRESHDQIVTTVLSEQGPL